MGARKIHQGYVFEGHFLWMDESLTVTQNGAAEVREVQRRTTLQKLLLSGIIGKHVFN